VTSALELFDAWLAREITPFMTERGFVKSRTSYLLKRPRGVTGVIKVRKDRYSRAEHVFFDLQAGVYVEGLARLAHEITGERQPPPPSIEGCTWILYHSDLMPPEDSPDAFDAAYGWNIPVNPSEGDLRRLTGVVQRRLADVAIPTIERMASEEAMRDVLLEEPDRWPLGPYLSTALALDIVRRLGPDDEVPRLKRRLARSHPPRPLELRG
jgi:hypothetical protein